MSQNLPKHIGIIMDGNGRWAKRRFLPRIAGHKQGVQALKKIVEHASQRGIQLLTVYAFSTENWQRPKKEVNYIMSLPKVFFDDYLPELMAQNCRVEWIGDESALPDKTRQILFDAVEATKDNTGLRLNFALNYGGQQEITQAVQALAHKVQVGDLDPEAISPQMIADHLSTARYGDLANPELIIRTSGELRLSNFLTWQSAYSELYFTDLYWPDFDPEAFDQALSAYQKRQRRFGRIEEGEEG